MPMPGPEIERLIKQALPDAIKRSISGPGMGMEIGSF